MNILSEKEKQKALYKKYKLNALYTVLGIATFASALIIGGKMDAEVARAEEAANTPTEVVRGTAHNYGQLIITDDGNEWEPQDPPEFYEGQRVYLAHKGSQITNIVEAEYPQTIKVVKADEETGILTLQTSTGYTYQWNGLEDFYEGDYAAVLMDTNGTQYITDDEILDIRYSGF